MRVLRFRAVENPTFIECGIDINVNGGGRFPVHFIWISTGGSPTLTITNNVDNPIKFKVIIGGVLHYDSGYFGDPTYQDPLDSILESNYLPTEIIDNVDTKSTIFPVSTIGTEIDIKIYCPFASSSFQFNFTC